MRGHDFPRTARSSCTESLRNHSGSLGKLQGSASETGRVYGWSFNEEHITSDKRTWDSGYLSVRSRRSVVRIARSSGCLGASGN